jgi:hypothetical protein
MVGRTSAESYTEGAEKKTPHDVRRSFISGSNDGFTIRATLPVMCWSIYPLALFLQGLRQYKEG